MLGNSTDAEDKPVVTASADSLRATIKSTVAKLDNDGKQLMKKKLTEANLHTNFAKVTDVNVLQQILKIVSE